MDEYGPAGSLLPIHVFAGTLALVFGYVALFARKGARTHRTTGMVFAAAMAPMALSGAVIAALDPGGSPVNVVGGLLTLYLVTTALLTVRPISHAGWLHALGAIVALAVMVLGLRAGFATLDSARAAPAFIFAVVAALAARGDLRLWQGGAIPGAARLRRHLWRMCFAMWIAASSFFWGPLDRVPEALRDPVLRAIAVLAPIVVMLFWLWRLRTPRAAHPRPAEAAAPAGS